MRNLIVEEGMQEIGIHSTIQIVNFPSIYSEWDVRANVAFSEPL